MRLVLVGWHFCMAIAIVAVVYPLVGHVRQLELKKRWSRQLLSHLGVRIRASGHEAAATGLIVANHVSWLDVFAINALRPSAFVCKAEVRRWPVISWLCARADTIFLERGRGRAAKLANASINAVLRAGVCPVTVFPEGTTTDGTELLAFRSALLQPAIDAQAGLIPVAVRYTTEAGQPSAAAAYCGDTSLWQSLLRIAGAADLTVNIEFLPALRRVPASRRFLALHVRSMIAASLPRGGEADQGRPAPAAHVRQASAATITQTGVAAAAPSVSYNGS